MTATMTPPTHISVTEEHIRKGTPSRTCDCPVALAIADALDSPLAVPTVDQECITLWDADLCREWTARVPESVLAFVAAFDEGSHVEPFEFDLEWHELTPSGDPA